MISHDAVIDNAAFLRASDAEKIAVTLAWREHFALTNPQSQRDEWGRAFCRHMLPYIKTTRPN